MAWLPALPFERGTTHDSGTLGGVPVTNLGAKIMLGDGTVLQICKNTDAAALSGCKLVDYESALSAGVTEASGAGSQILAGVVDPALANKGNTVPVNALFYVVKQGVTYVLAGASVTVNVGLQSHATDGTCQDANTLVSNQAGKVFGVALAATASGSSVLCLVSFKG